MSRRGEHRAGARYSPWVTAGYRQDTQDGKTRPLAAVLAEAKLTVMTLICTSVNSCSSCPSAPTGPGVSCGTFEMWMGRPVSHKTPRSAGAAPTSSAGRGVCLRGPPYCGPSKLTSTLVTRGRSRRRLDGDSDSVFAFDRLRSPRFLRHLPLVAKIPRTL